jgi:hypothetical protein
MQNVHQSTILHSYFRILVTTASPEVILTNRQLATLPDKLSYSTTNITSPKGFTTRLPRRELFDVRLQLMAEDDGSSQTPLTGLDVTMPFFLSSPLSHMT